MDPFKPTIEKSFSVFVTLPSAGGRDATLPKLDTSTKLRLKPVTRDAHATLERISGTKIGAFMNEQFIGLINSPDNDDLINRLLRDQKYLIEIQRVREHSLKISIAFVKEIERAPLEPDLPPVNPSSKPSNERPFPSPKPKLKPKVDRPKPKVRQTERRESNTAPKKKNSASALPSLAELRQDVTPTKERPRKLRVLPFILSFLVCIGFLYVIAPEKTRKQLSSVIEQSSNSLKTADENSNIKPNVSSNSPTKNLSLKNNTNRDSSQRINDFKTLLRAVLQREIVDVSDTLPRDETQVTFRLTDDGRIKGYHTSKGQTYIPLLDRVIRSSVVPRAPKEISYVSVNLLLPTNRADNRTNSGKSNSVTERQTPIIERPISANSLTHSIELQTGEFPWVDETDTENKPNSLFQRKPIDESGVQQSHPHLELRTGEFPWIDANKTQTPQPLDKDEIINTEDIKRPNVELPHSQKVEQNASIQHPANKKREIASPPLVTLRGVISKKVTPFTRKLQIVVETDWRPGEQIPTFNIASASEYADYDLLYDEIVTPSFHFEFNENNGSLHIKSKKRVKSNTDYVVLIRVKDQYGENLQYVFASVE